MFYERGRELNWGNYFAPLEDMPAPIGPKPKKTVRHAPNYIRGGPPPKSVTNFKEMSTYYGPPLVVTPPPAENAKPK